MHIDEYKRAVIAYLQSGKATDAEWAEVGEHLLAASEQVQPLLLDQSLGFAGPCPNCGEVGWYDDALCNQCGTGFGDVVVTGGEE